ncbi:ABC-2 type transport system ATP-binding protein [Plasticicumulans lactativorans]|uniref:ABC-2 type transport system ATP-binding protein n=1 Tax=Plasticicumulans lactativorans TaxID=1133106 RepID=A0A4R2L7C9_9GAMM|nr:ABC transporter ATP-binding protein [Plasticicumulans lactativorans]TCO83399.1 ABC-2 type transport system ATP-binding protein [Plasticicumulans lactativorans]
MAEADAAPLLAVSGLRKCYGSRTALDGVTLAVGRGEFVALLGPNGAGKSTLFQVLSGLFVADAGQVEVAGCDMQRAPVPALARTGIVFQQPTLDLDLTVLANLRFHARLHGLAPAHAQARIDAELARQGLAERAREPARALSGGNRRKVELARALVHEPALLLLDEPTVGLDPAARRHLLEQVHGLCAERGLGVLWATHLVDEAEAADRVVVLHHGRVRYAGPPAGLRAEAGAAALADAFLALTAPAP